MSAFDVTNLKVEKCLILFRNLLKIPYQNKNVSTSLWSIYLGLKQKPENFGVTQYSTFIYPDWIRSLRDIPPTISLLRNPPGEKVPGFVFVDYNQIDSDLTDEGYYLGVLCGLDHISNWIDMDEETYRLRKEQWIDTFIQTLDTSFPGISESIIYKEMATARTVKDYLNTPQGAVYGFAQEPKQAGRLRPHGKTSIKGLWLTSAFTFPGGGFSGAMLAGECAVRELLRGERINARNNSKYWCLHKYVTGFLGDILAIKS